MKNTLCISFLSLSLLSSMASADVTNPAAPIIAAFAKLNLNPQTTAGLAIDVQEDFTVNNSYKTEKKDGSLAVANSGNDYIAKVIAFTQHLKENNYRVIASQDHHPEDHMSFADNNPGKKTFEAIETTIPTQDGGTKTIKQVMWPRHCVQNTAGARILIPTEQIDYVIKKGENSKVDSYSAFADDGGQETGLTDLLNKNNIDTVVVYGIATDYCVKFSVLDALTRGKKVYVILDLCHGVADESSQKAIAEMKAAGAIIVTDNSQACCKCSHHSH